jgi:hypothetical protein
MQSLQQLDAVIAMAQTEYEALLGDDLTMVESLCAERDKRMGEALLQAAAAPREALCERLRSLQDIQQKLHATASSRKEVLRGELLRVKGESRRMNGYHRCLAGQGAHYLP